MERIRATQITSKALKTRRLHLGIESHLPVCPYTLCEAMNLELRFVRIPSFEGMYIPSERLVLISSDRPEGRKRFTCAHEIGHHELGHGTVIDEIVENGSDKQEEKEADLFASMLLMPSSAVRRAMARYNVAAEDLKNLDAYVLSKYFGVSYQAFLVHLCYNLKLISLSHFRALTNVNLGDLRKSISGMTLTNQVFLVGHWWDEKAIDMEVGDVIVSKDALSTDGPAIIKPIKKDETQHIYEAISPGIVRIYSEVWSCFSKISRKNFEGFFQFRYDEEEE